MRYRTFYDTSRHTRFATTEEKWIPDTFPTHHFVHFAGINEAKGVGMLAVSNHKREFLPKGGYHELLEDALERYIAEPNILLPEAVRTTFGLRQLGRLAFSTRNEASIRVHAGVVRIRGNRVHAATVGEVQAHVGNIPLRQQRNLRWLEPCLDSDSDHPMRSNMSVPYASAGQSVLLHTPGLTVPPKTDAALENMQRYPVAFNDYAAIELEL